MWAKLLKWSPMVIVAFLGILQVGIKFVKEVLTLVIDLLLPIIPGDKFDALIKKIRDGCNTVDAWIEKIKDFLLGRSGS